MSISTEIDALKTWWHDFIDHLFKHPQAAAVAPEAIAAAATAQAIATQKATVTIPGSQQQISGVMANILGVNQATSDILNGRVGQGDNVTLTPDVIVYDHHQPQHFKVGTTPVFYSTEEVQAGRATVVACTYCENSPEKVQIWEATESKDPPGVWWNVGSAPTVLLPAGKRVVGIVADKDGLVDLQLRNA